MKNLKIEFINKTVEEDPRKILFYVKSFPKIKGSKMSTITTPSAGIFAYLDAICFHPQIENLEKLLDNDVELHHIGDGKKITEFKGKKAVLDAYATNLIGNTTQIIFKQIEILGSYAGNPPIVGKLLANVDETKKNYKGIKGESHWNFVDQSDFNFKKLQDGSLKISKITMKIVSTRLDLYQEKKTSEANK